MEAKRATLESMGLRSEKAVAKHILQENVWESNLILDIAGVDYFAGHQGQTNLQPLDGLPAFVDDSVLCLWAATGRADCSGSRAQGFLHHRRRELCQKSHIAYFSLCSGSLGRRRRVQKPRNLC